MRSDNEIDTKSNSFLRLLKSTYNFYKQKIKQDSQLLNALPDIHKKQKKRQERTRSKSRKKSLRAGCSSISLRKSMRINKLTEEKTQFVEIDKQPLWHNKKRKEGKKSYKKGISPTLISSLTQTTRIKPSNPVYQFYSQPIDQQIPHEQQQIQQQNPSSPQYPQLHDSSSNNINNNKIQEAEKAEKAELLGWKPTKQQTSLLAIQSLIDEYILFKQALRINQKIKLIDLVKYVRDIKSYYFNLDVLQSLIRVNQELYTIGHVDKEKFLQCRKLNHDIVEQRQFRTKVKMMKMSMQQIQAQF